jgi:hypothetical protein
MLEPQGRSDLFAALQPPQDYVLDYAIGTTYSLDLMALLTVPLAYTVLGTVSANGRPDPLALLDGMRRYADRMTVFVQAGQIAVPAGEQLLFTYLEQTVVEVVAPSRHGVFHPKVWALRFIPDPSSPVPAHPLPVRYRFLCLSRNLTFDRSWDTILTLDGELIDRQYAYGKYHPLGEFFEGLPGMAIRQIPEGVQERIDQFQHELRRVKFETPQPFESFDFFPMGIKRGESWPYGNSTRRLLIISPFLDFRFLQRITDQCSESVLVSRLDGPNGLESFSAEDLAAFKEIFVLSPNANPEEHDVEEMHGEGRAPSPWEPPLTGLHAKVYVAEQWGQKRRVHLWTGSANATTAAIKHNVEFMVRLTGRSRYLAIDKLLQESENEINLRDLLETYKPPETAATTDPLELRLDHRLWAAQRLLLTASFAAEALPTANEDRYHLRLAWSGEAVEKVLSSVRVRCWPITLAEQTDAKAITGDEHSIRFGPLSAVAVTSFFAIELEAAIKERTATIRFVLNVPLENPPGQRRERIVRHLLADRQSVLRYLLLLLSDPGELSLIGGELMGTGVDDGERGLGSGLGLPVHLFESLTQALGHRPETLKDVKRLVDELTETGSESLLPTDFAAVWVPVWAAYEQIRVSKAVPETDGNEPEQSAIDED